MVARKLSISLDEDVAVRAQKLANADGVTLSALIGRSLQDRLILADGIAAMEEWQEEHGAFTPEELAEADAFVDRVEAAHRPGGAE